MNEVKKSLIFSLVMLILGIIMIAVFALGLVPENYSKSILMSTGFVLASGGVYWTFRLSKNIRNAEKVEETELIMNDERNVMLREKTSAKVYSIFVYVECVITFIAGLLGYRWVSLLFSILVLAKFVVWYIVCVNFSKKY